MKKRKAIMVLILVLLATGGAGYYFYYQDKTQGSRDTIRLYGNVDIREIKLAFQATGRIQKIHVQEGDKVRAGQLLAELDPVRYEASVAKAKAEVAAKKQVLARLLAGSRPEEIAQARARLANALAGKNDKEKIFQRRKVLAKTKAIPQQELDDALASYLSALAKVDEARQAMILAVKGPRQEDINAARAELAAAEAALRLAQHQLTDTKLYCPSKGVIQQRILEPGDIAFDQTPVFSVALTDPVWVRAYLEEPDLGKVRPGMLAVIKTDSFPGKSYRAWVGYISPSGEFTPKQVETQELRTKLVYRVRIHACNPGGELRLGMPVTVLIPLKLKQTGQGKPPCRKP